MDVPGNIVGNSLIPSRFKPRAKMFGLLGAQLHVQFDVLRQAGRGEIAASQDSHFVGVVDPVYIVGFGMKLLGGVAARLDSLLLEQFIYYGEVGQRRIDETSFFQFDVGMLSQTRKESGALCSVRIVTEENANRIA